MRPNKNNLFFYRGDTQFGNLGDLLINKSLLDLLSAKGTILIDDILLPPYYLQTLTERVYNTKLISSTNKTYKYIFRKKTILNFFKRKEEVYVINMPGHSFHKNNFSLSLRKAIFLRKLYQLLGVKFIRVGISIGPFSDGYLQFFAQLHRKNYLLAFRDTDSLRLAKEAGIQKAILAPDLAWGYDVEKFHPNIRTVKRETKKVVLSFRGAIMGIKENTAYLSRIKELVKLLVTDNQDYSFVFAYQTIYDESISRELYEDVKGRNNVSFISELLTLETALNLYASSSFVVSNRLHVLLAAILTETLPIALTDLSEHSKITSLFTDNGLSHFLVDLDSKKQLGEKLSHFSAPSTFLSNQQQIRKINEDNKRKLHLLFNQYL